MGSFAVCSFLSAELLLRSHECVGEALPSGRNRNDSRHDRVSESGDCDFEYRVSQQRELQRGASLTGSSYHWVSPGSCGSGACDSASKEGTQ